MANMLKLHDLNNPTREVFVSMLDIDTISSTTGGTGSAILRTGTDNPILVSESPAQVWEMMKEAEQNG